MIASAQAVARVVFDHVSKRYARSEPVVRDLSLTVEDKELLVLVGPSGCGKSTALRMIAGLESVTAGTLLIGDTRMNDIAPKDRDVAMVFQSYALYPHMTCFENMAFALALRNVKRPDIDKRVREAARALAIEHLLERRPRELSGGQRQRVAIGRAIVREPRVFLMDEPLSNLDAKLRTSMRAELKRLHRDLAATIVYVTHDQTEAMTLGDRIAVLRAGELLQCDTPHNIYRRPATAFVAAFIGSPEMNLLGGDVVVNGSVAVRGRGFHIAIPAGPLARALTTKGSERVLVGVRPEHLSIGAPRRPQHAARAYLQAKVELVESTGADTYVHASSDAGRVAAKLLEGPWPAVGSAVHLSASMEDVHLFDRATEARVA